MAARLAGTPAARDQINDSALVALVSRSGFQPAGNDKVPCELFIGKGASRPLRVVH